MDRIRRTLRLHEPTQRQLRQLAVLVESLLPIIDANGGDSDEVREEILNTAQGVFSDAMDRAMRSKMGLVVVRLTWTQRRMNCGERLNRC